MYHGALFGAIPAENVSFQVNFHRCPVMFGSKATGSPSKLEPKRAIMLALALGGLVSKGLPEARDSAMASTSSEYVYIYSNPFDTYFECMI